LKELPEAMPAFIWYPYADSPEFPQVGSGGRNAMAGPIYYAEMFPKKPVIQIIMKVNYLFMIGFVDGSKR